MPTRRNEVRSRQEPGSFDSGFEIEYGTSVKPTVYVENSVVSYLTARRAQANVRVAAHQDLTREWWDSRRDLFELYASAVVVEEAQDGNPSAAAARLEVIAQL